MRRLGTIGHAVTSGRSQAMFLHGSFGSNKSHFMAVLREILQHNPDARAVRGLAEPVARADEWLKGKRILVLSFHADRRPGRSRSGAPRADPVHLLLTGLHWQALRQLSMACW
jgi:hypothetical protein